MAFFDGEQIPEDRIKEIFRTPPDVPTEFSRNTLIVGSRGVGKTTLFRYLKAKHGDPAIHIALGAELSAFGKSAAIGPLAGSLPPEIESQIALQATSLLAVSFAGRLAGKNLSVRGEAIAECLPPALLTPPRTITPEWCRTARSTLSHADLRTFESIPGVGVLARFLEHCGELMARQHGSLLLLIDRADMVVPASLRPAMALLDQSSHYKALIAMRPGHTTGAFTADEVDPSVGDHSDVICMGKTPYSQTWHDFMIEAVKAQLGSKCFDHVPTPVLEHLLIVSRESLRNALELASAVTGAASASAHEALVSGIEAVEDNLTLAIQQVLQKYKMDYRRFLTSVRKEIAPAAGELHGYARLSLNYSPAVDLFERNDRLDHFVGACLRSRAVCVPNGQLWSPALRVSEVEIPSIYLWKRGDNLLSLASLREYPIARRTRDLLAAGGPVTRGATIFVAYRINVPGSKEFRTKLADVLKHIPSRHEIVVTDGNVVPGVDWAPEIRDRIKRSRVLVGDVTGLRNDVMFEVGFAYGLRKVFIPVLESSSQICRVPEWLTSKQCGSYESEERLLAIATSVLAHLTDQSLQRLSSRARDPVPGLAVGLWSQSLSEKLEPMFSAVCAREGLDSNVVQRHSPVEDQIEAATRSACLVIALDGTAADGLAHFLCGAVVARPQVGYGTKHMQRKILITGHGDPEAIRSRAAPSLRKCHQNVQVADLDKLYDHLKEFGGQDPNVDQ